jgi:hypothetical protein
MITEKAMIKFLPLCKNLQSPIADMLNQLHQRANSRKNIEKYHFIQSQCNSHVRHAKTQITHQMSYKLFLLTYLVATSLFLLESLSLLQDYSFTRASNCLIVWNTLQSVSTPWTNDYCYFRNCWAIMVTNMLCSLKFIRIKLLYYWSMKFDLMYSR